MKKIFCIAITLVLALGMLSACGEKEEVVDEKSAAVEEKSEELKENAAVIAEETIKAAEETDEKATATQTKEKTSSTPKKNKTTSTKKSDKKTESNLPAPSKNKEVATADNAPEVHIISEGGDNTTRICYHLKDCSTLKGTTHQKVTWELIEMLQFRQCPECNPPRYADYVE